MNIAYVMRYWPIYGGGETITVTLANELVKRGHNVYVIYTFDKLCTPMPYEVLKTVDIRSPKTVISVHFTSSKPMAMQSY